MNKENLLKKPYVVCLVAAFCSLLWGSAFPCLKIGYGLFSIYSSDTASQILFAGIRFTLAGILAVIMGSAAKKKLLIPKRTDFSAIAILSLFQTVLQYLFFYIGLANTSGVKASVIVGANVFIAIVIASLIFRTEKITPKKILGSIIGFSGIVIINLSGLTDGSLRLSGEGFILLSTVAYAFSSGLMKKFSSKHDTTLLSSYQFIFGGIVMTAAGLAMGGNVQTEKLSGVLMLIYLAFISAAAYSLWSLLLKHNEVSSVAIYGFMNPMFGFILSAILLEESSEAFGIKGICAILLVCLGIFVVNKKEKVKLLSECR